MGVDISRGWLVARNRILWRARRRDVDRLLLCAVRSLVVGCAVFGVSFSRRGTGRRDFRIGVDYCADVQADCHRKTGKRGLADDRVLLGTFSCHCVYLYAARH